MASGHCSILLIAALFLFATTGDSTKKQNECVYTPYVKTGSVFKAGTDSKISLTLGDSSGQLVWVPNLESWGLMGPKHDYYERGNVDTFSGRGPCIGASVCHLNLTSDGSGSHSGWYCDYVKVTSSGPHRKCSQTIFYVDRWLANDAPPFQLSAIVDGCAMWNNAAADHRRKNGPFVVRNPKKSA
ncbi:PLAT domain-containing protein 3-like [Fagus crenata]